MDLLHFLGKLFYQHAVQSLHSSRALKCGSNSRWSGVIKTQARVYYAVLQIFSLRKCQSCVHCKRKLSNKTVQWLQTIFCVFLTKAYRCIHLYVKLLNLDAVRITVSQQVISMPYRVSTVSEYS